MQKKDNAPNNQLKKELKKGRHKEVSKLRPRKMSPKRCFQKEHEALVWRRIISIKWKWYLLPSPKPIDRKHVDHAHLEEAPEGWEHVGRDGGRLDEDAACVEGAFVVDGSFHEQDEMDGRYLPEKSYHRYSQGRLGGGRLEPSQETPPSGG
jgi:hypothetical protein